MSWLNHIIIRHQFGAFVLTISYINLTLSVRETCLTIARHLWYAYIQFKTSICQLGYLPNVGRILRTLDPWDKLQWTNQNIIIFVRKICPNVSSEKCWPFSLNLWNTWNITCRCPWDSTLWWATNCWIQVKSTTTPTWAPSQYKDRLSQVWGFPC